MPCKRMAGGSKARIDRGWRKAVRRIQELGMVMDVSHINDKGFWDIMNLAQGR